MYLKHYYIRLNISQTTIEPDQRSEGGDEYRYKVQGSYLHNDIGRVEVLEFSFHFSFWSFIF